MREIEIVYWAALNTEEDIKALINDLSKNEKEANTMQATQAIRSRLMMTAYYTKGQLSSEATELAVKEFFKHHFGDFVDKHTEWDLLYEPPTITP